MSAGSADYFRFNGAFEGCISGHDSDFSHRPYHKNCRCALHDKSRRPGIPPPARCNTVSYPLRRSRSEGSLALAVSAASPASSSVTPCSSPAPAVESVPTHRRLRSLEICVEEDDLFLD